MVLLPSLSLLCSCVLLGTPPTFIDAADFGVVADGVTDDGPAIQRMLDAPHGTGPVHLRFPEGKTIRVKTMPTRYVFPLEGQSHVAIDGGGSTFLLDPWLRFLDLAECRDITVRRLNVDFDPLPFADGTVVAIDAAARTMDVRLADWVGAAPSGGPTKEDGEQAFFAMLWHDGPYSTLSHHCWVEDQAPLDGGRTVRLQAAESFHAWDQVVPGEWRISLPVPGVAHRYGPGHCFRIDRNDTVTFEDVELWTAPWFGFGVSRNTGEVTFRRVHIRPKPGTARFMSTWRDGFHVKGNAARLLWEDCVLQGMNDDAFNISTHSSVVSKPYGTARFEVRQKFPLVPMPWHEGATVVAVDEASKRLLGTATVVGVETGASPPDINGHPAAPVTTLTLDRPIPGLAEGTMVWDPAQCNPDTTLRRCRIDMSCRMQSPMTLEDCEVNALLWFYAEHVEGGFPHHVTLRGCTLRRGRGNPENAVIIAGGAAPNGDGTPPRAIHDVTLESNTIHGGLNVLGVERLVLRGNRLEEPGAPAAVTACYETTIEDNTVAGGRLQVTPPPAGDG